MPSADRSSPAVALVAAGEVFGGVERFVLDLSRALRVAGVRVGIALFHDAELARRARAHSLEPRILPARKRSTMSAALSLADWLRRERFSMVHVHGCKASIVAALARAWVPFDSVATIHGLPEPAAPHSLRTVKSLAYARLDDTALRGLRASVCYVTHELQGRFLPRHAGLARRVVPNGVGRLQRGAYPRPPELGPRGFHLALVGRLQPVKGQRYALQALADRAVAADTQLHLLGTGDSADGLRRLAAALGVAGRVHFHGFREDVHAFVTHSDALLMPSLHEGLPYTLLEAMALATPVIATRTGGLAEVLRDEDTALLVAPGDACAMARAIARVRAQPALAASLAARAHALQASEFSLERMAQAYLDVYRSPAARGAFPVQTCATSSKG